MGQPVSGKNFVPYAGAATSLFLSTPGNHAGDESGAAFPTALVSLDEPRGDSPAGYYPGQAWWVDAIAGDSASRGTVVFLGDSITEGYAASGPPGQRASDIIGARLAAAQAAERVECRHLGQHHHRGAEPVHAAGGSLPLLRTAHSPAPRP